MRDPNERFDEKVDRSGECWLWLAQIASNGYGRFWLNGRSMPAHRFAYEREHGPLPEGLQIDHLCRVKSCVRPDHLEAVTGRENLLRGDTFQAANAAKTHCPRGHPYSHTVSGRRVCRTCLREAGRRYWTSKGRDKRASRRSGESRS